MPPVAPLLFDTDWYTARYPDVGAAKRGAKMHYRTSGCYENRLPCAPDTGPLALVNQARHLAQQGQWQDAHGVFCQLSEDDLVTGLMQFDLCLLAHEIALRAQDQTRAMALMKAMVSAFEPKPALHLAKANADQSLLRMSHISDALPKGKKLTLDTAARTAFDGLSMTLKRRFASAQHPLVSVIVPALNAAETLATALRSLTGQTWPALQILVVDNGSTDATAQIAKKAQQADPRITVLSLNDDKGTYAARNAGLAAATGAFVTVHDADDWAHPQKIKRQVKALLKDKTTVANRSFWVRATEDLFFTNLRADVGLVHANASSLMIRRDALAALGFWDRVRADADTEYLQRLRAVYGSQAVKDINQGVPLAIGRVHEASLTRSKAIGLGSETRRTYQSAAAQWHTSGQPLFLPQHPKTRPFPAPPALLPEDAQ